jgi:hypothetical protein
MGNKFFGMFVSVPVVRARKDSKDLIISAFEDQIKILGGEKIKVATRSDKNGVKEDVYLRSWYNQKTGYVVPKVASLSLIPDEKASGGGKGVPLSEGLYGEFLTSMLDAFKNDDPEAVAVTTAFDKQRAARDERLNKSRKDGKKKK